MRRGGIGTIADVLFLATLISLSCLVLIQGVPSGNTDGSEAYARRTAQNFLLSLQKMRVGKFDNFSFDPDLPVFIPSGRKSLEGKTFSQLIKEDILLNPTWNRVGISDENEVESEFGRELKRVLRLALENLIGGRYGYRFVVRLEPFRLPDGRVLKYRRMISDLDGYSRKVCSESVCLNFTVPGKWATLGADDFRYFGDYGDLNYTLEVWVK